MLFTINDVTKYLETIAPLNLQESYDNSGLLAGEPNTPVTGILLALDAVEEIVEEAIHHNCNLIITHHPIIFKGLKTLTGKNYVERTVIKAIRNHIGLYAIHTNLDNVLHNGVNERIANQINLQNQTILSPKTDNTEAGAGIIGTLQSPMNENEFLGILKNTMKTSCIKHTKFLNRPIHSVAICGGAGSFLIPNAINAGADAFITSDLKYHEFFDADNHLLLADIGHYESEQYTIDLLYDIIQQKMSTFALRKTELLTNPVRYLF